MTCLRFCNSDAMCGEQNAFCNVPIQCGTPPLCGLFPPLRSHRNRGRGLCRGAFVLRLCWRDHRLRLPGLGDVGAACTQNSGCNGETACAGCRAGLSASCRPAPRRQQQRRLPPDLHPGHAACPTGTTCHAFDSSTRLVYGFCQ
jgi:hypothetical protein